MILDIRVSDHSSHARGLYLTIADRSKAALIIHCAIVMHRRFMERRQEAVRKKDGIRTEEARGHHHICRRDIVLNPIKDKGLLHTDTIGVSIGVLHIFLQVLRVEESNIII